MKLPKLTPSPRCGTPAWQGESFTALLRYAVGGGWLVLGMMLVSPLAHATENTMRPQTELVRLVRQDCGSCHGLRLTGGLGSPLTAAALAARDLPLTSIEATITHGRPGTAMPAWKSILSPREVTWIAEQLLLGFPEEK